MLAQVTVQVNQVKSQLSANANIHQRFECCAAHEKPIRCLQACAAATAVAAHAHGSTRAAAARAAAQQHHSSTAQHRTAQHRTAQLRAAR